LRILAIETAVIEVGVALADETGPLASVTARPGRRQAETVSYTHLDVYKRQDPGQSCADPFSRRADELWKGLCVGREG